MTSDPTTATGDGRRESVEAELAAKRDHLESLRHRRATLVEEIDAFEATGRSPARSNDSELTALGRQANRQALELHRVDTGWETLTEHIHDVVDSIGSRGQLVAERTRKIDRRSDREFEVDRIEADRGGDTGRTVPVLSVRPAGSGPDEAISIDRVGERSRTVAAVLTRLAGYVVHEDHETVPFLLLDLPDPVAVGVTDDTFAYLEQHAEYVVVSADDPLASVSVAADDRRERE